jgi:hypothetical protein
MGHWVTPLEVLHDGGTEFTNKSVRELFAMCGVKDIKTLAYSKEENSLVERANKEVMRHLRDIIFDARVDTDWSTYVPLVQRIINSQVHSKTGLAPMELVWGKTLDLNRGIMTQREKPTENLSEWINKMIHSQKVAIQIASEKQLASDCIKYKKLTADKISSSTNPNFLWEAMY